MAVNPEITCNELIVLERMDTKRLTPFAKHRLNHLREVFDLIPDQEKSQEWKLTNYGRKVEPSIEHWEECYNNPSFLMPNPALEAIPGAIPGKKW